MNSRERTGEPRIRCGGTGRGVTTRLRSEGVWERGAKGAAIPLCLCAGTVIATGNTSKGTDRAEKSLLMQRLPQGGKVLGSDVDEAAARAVDVGDQKERNGDEQGHHDEEA